MLCRYSVEVHCESVARPLLIKFVRSGTCTACQPLVKSSDTSLRRGLCVIGELGMDLPTSSCPLAIRNRFPVE